MTKLLKKMIAITLSVFILLLGASSNVDASSKHLLIINSKINTMGYYIDNKLVKEFQVGTGKYGTKTPTGKFTIVNKIVNRPYYSGGIPGGDPRNPLGDRWLGLHVGNTYGTTYGIHGTNNENSIGGNVSGGCIRMYNNEVRWLFDRVPTGTTVLISETSNTYSQIAAQYGVNIENVASKWKSIDGSWYYLNESEHYQRNSWKLIDGKWYHFDSKGKMQTGWLRLGEKWYYLKPSGEMAIGWLRLGEKWYYLKSNGEMQTGWLKLGEKWYYLKSSGEMATGWYKEGNTWYYLKFSGEMTTGWQKVGRSWYYFNGSGAMKTGWVSDAGKWYYLKSSGEMATGWLNVDGETYYLNSDGSMQLGEVVIDNIKYIFNENGELISQEDIAPPTEDIAPSTEDLTSKTQSEEIVDEDEIFNEYVVTPKDESIESDIVE